jgi:hypothetical protein
MHTHRARAHTHTHTHTHTGDAHADASASDDESDQVVWGPSHGVAAGGAHPRDQPEWFSDESAAKPRSRAVAQSVVRCWRGSGLSFRV